MATSNAMSTSNQYVKYKITVTQNSQNITSNKSNVTVSVKFYRTNTGYTTYGTGTVYCKINGTTYSTSVDPSQKITSSGIVLFSKTLDISHNDDGKKSLTCSAWISHNAVTSTEQSYTQTLTTIPRKSTLAVSNGTLNTSQNLTVTRQSSNFTHTITAVCGSSSVTVCSKSTSTTIAFTPPLSWASQNTSGTSVSVKYTITTYSGNTNIGSNSIVKTCSIPVSVKPSCSISVSDPTGYSATYGGYIKGKSKISIAVNPTLSYGSSIVVYSTKTNGATYSSKTFTTGALKSSGTVSVNTTVKDGRGRTGSSTVSVNVIDYNAPNVSKLNVKRCDQNGVEDDKGEYIKVIFSCLSTSLDSKNKTSYDLKVKKSTETDWTQIDISGFNGQYEIIDSYHIFKADTGSSYDITLTVTDSFETVARTTKASTATTIMHIKANGLGVSFGKVSELDNVLDVEYQTRLNGGLLYPLLENGTDFNLVLIPGFYTIKSIQASSYSNCPLRSGTATLTVESCGESGQIRQIVTVCNKTAPLKYERCFYQNSWGEWAKTSDFNGKLLWSGAFYMNASQTIQLAEKISEQTSGIVLVFSRYSSSTARDYHFNTHFVPKMQIANHAGCGHTFLMSTDGTFSVFAAKYLYINDSNIVGNDVNESTGTGTCGIKYENNGFVLRYVIGV